MKSRNPLKRKKLASEKEYDQLIDAYLFKEAVEMSGEIIDCLNTFKNKRVIDISLAMLLALSAFRRSEMPESPAKDFVEAFLWIDELGTTFKNMPPKH